MGCKTQLLLLWRGGRGCCCWSWWQLHRRIHKVRVWLKYVIWKREKETKKEREKEKKNTFYGESQKSSIQYPESSQIRWSHIPTYCPFEDPTLAPNQFQKFHIITIMCVIHIKSAGYRQSINQPFTSSYHHQVVCTSTHHHHHHCDFHHHIQKKHEKNTFRLFVKKISSDKFFLVFFFFFENCVLHKVG